MAETKTILFNGGLVTARDPSTLRSDAEYGELSVADDSEYLPNDPGIWPVLGRATFNETAEAGPIVGAGYVQFDSAVDRIITLVGTTYRQANIAETGAFSTLVSGLTGTATLFDQACLGNFHLLMNGVDRNYVIGSDLTTSPQGMLRNASAPTVSRDAGVGTGFILSSGNTIGYWVEERVKSGDTILRRNAASTTTIVTHTGDGTTDKPVITRPVVANSDATHWALFATATNGDFPVGAEIAEVPIATTTIEDTRTGTNPGLAAGDTYPTVTVELNGLNATVPKYDQAPISSTGDVFEGSVVQNDVANRSHLRFTFPGEIHAHNSFNVIDIRTKRKDRVVWIRSLGRSVLIGMDQSLWRVDTLPLPEDAGFQPDRIRTEIDGAFGGVSPLAVAKFSFGEDSLIAYVSRQGIVVTNGSTWDILSADVDWDSTVNVEQLHKSVLVYNPRRYRLEFYYAPFGVSSNTKVLYYNVHPSHRKGNRAKVCGPNNCRALSAFNAPLPSGTFYTFTGHADGRLYREGVGTADAAGDGGIAFRVLTGDLYLNGVGGEATFRRGYMHHSAGADGQTATALQIMRAEGEDDTPNPETFDVSRREATAVYEEGLADAFQFGVSMANPVQRVRFDYLVVEYDEMQEEQSD